MEHLPTFSSAEVGTKSLGGEILRTLRQIGEPVGGELIDSRKIVHLFVLYKGQSSAGINTTAMKERLIWRKTFR